MAQLTPDDPNRRDAPDPLMAQLHVIFTEMDQRYQVAAAPDGFVCSGCDQNCCRSLFFHHTYAEWLYLRRGVATLPTAKRLSLAAAARDYLARKQPGDVLFCPASDQGRCALYDHRPMICRLHGIPHVTTRPDGRQVEGPGCDAFYKQGGTAAHPLLDRTPLYAAMAAFENQLRQAIGLSARLKMTVAEMIATPLPQAIAKKHETS